MSLNQEDQRRDALAFRLYAATKPKGTTPPITYGAHSTTGRYAGNNMSPARTGANDHLLVASRSTGGEIALLKQRPS